MTARRPLVVVGGRTQELPLDDTIIGFTPEEDVSYSKRVDFVSDTLLYKGEAATGSAESGAVWRVHKIVFGTDGDVTETWADGNANFDNVWNDRATLSYS